MSVACSVRFPPPHACMWAGTCDVLILALLYSSGCHLCSMWTVD